MESRPNVLWIVADQLRAQALSIHGDPNVHTPNIDFLARTGVDFTDAVSGCPLCCPFRGAMLTGLYPHKSAPGHDTRMPPAQKTVADILGDHGYDTFYLGKWHLDGGPQSGERAALHYVAPERRGGFAGWLGYENNNAQLDCWLHGHRDGQEIPPFRLEGYETDALTDLMAGYIRQKADAAQPFFAVLSVQPPHNHYVAPPAFARHHPAHMAFRENVPAVKPVRERAARELAGYYDMIENLDDNVGRILCTLRETGQLENTHILFFSDHGDQHGSHGQFYKTTAYEESVRIPLIISGEKQGAHEVGRRTGPLPGLLVNHADIAPTTLGLCGIRPPAWMQGFDYSSYRFLDRPQPDSPPDSAYLQSVIPTGHADSVNKAWRGLITHDRMKYVCFSGMDWLMFDLNTDPFEQVNLAHNEKYRTLRLRLRQRLAEWILQTGDQFLLPEL